MRRSTEKLTPNFDNESTNLLNFTVLQRFDPSIQEIILTASHVAFYEFNINDCQWSRKGVEGTLFVVKRDKEPFDQFIVMNQKSTENFVGNLSEISDFELQVPYLLYRNSSQEINGIWFFNPSECKLVADLFNRLISSYPRSISEPLVLNKSELKELGPIPSEAVTERQLESVPASSSSFINAADVTEFGSISDILSRAINISNIEKPVQTHHPSSEHSASIGSSNLIHSPTGLLQVPSSAATASSLIFQLINQHDVSDSNYQGNQIANLVTPAIFQTPHSSTANTLPPFSPSMSPMTLQPSLTLQRPHGIPSLQLYPPPPPPPSPLFSPQSAVAPTNGLVIDRGKVREALLELAQDNQFIDMFYKALQKVHQC